MVIEMNERTASATFGCDHQPQGSQPNKDMNDCRVRCGNCHELLYDPVVKEYYLKMDTEGRLECPRCGTVYFLRDSIFSNKHNIQIKR